ncbi:MAG: HAD family hydrolase [Alphaproteobacteria bacterium]|nr:HAD family hydrolase [Alphaproteobacteria bacterium]MBT5390457.1 HAD family hydrolase [Alphaproteobacteria bacterium]MBT5540478.1 HAD family hydrolase [Alphaproteobacteria bacterium]MBT5655179.1 HAD family hydrolase [Alphaproteobacteria bacterium]
MNLLEKIPFPKAILFDWDGTLVNVENVIFDVLSKTYVAMGKEAHDWKNLGSVVGHSLRDFFPTVFKDKSKQAEKKFYELYEQDHLEELKLVPGADSLLKYLKEQGIYTGIVSNKNGDYLRKEVEHLQLGSYFGSIVGSCDTPKDKPSRVPIDYALAGVGYSPEKDPVWYVGDRSVDLECAHNAECTPILISHINEVDDLNKFVYPPRLIINSPKELINVLQSPSSFC